MKEFEKILNGDSVRETLLSDDFYSDLTEMANMVGKDVTIEHVDFSFYFSDKSEMRHAIRVKVKWNRDHLAGTTDGYFDLHGDYKWTSSAGTKKVKQSDINKARRFFQKYKVLFAAVWESCLDANSVQKYFDGRMSFDDLMGEFLIDFDFSGIHSLEELEKCVRENNLFNMND